MSEYKKNKNWNMFVEENKLFITKGADEIYYLDDVPKESVDDIFKAYCNENFNDIDINILKKLEKVGVLYQKLYENNSSKIKVCFKYYGEDASELCNSITSFIEKRNNISITDKLEDSNLLIMIRVNGKLKNVN